MTSTMKAIMSPWVTRPSSSPQRGQFDRIVKFDLQNSDLDIQVQDNGWAGTTNRVTYTVSVSIEGTLAMTPINAIRPRNDRSVSPRPAHARAPGASNQV